MKDVQKNAREFYRIAAKLANRKTETEARKWWKAFFEEIVRELYVNGVVYLPLIGYFKLDYQKQIVRRKIDENGLPYWEEVPERDMPTFVPEDDFINDVNMKGVTKNYRYRCKHNQRTLRDRERYKRLQELTGDYEESTTRYEQLQEQYKDDFDRLMARKREDFEHKLKEKIKESSNGTTT